MYDKSQEKEQKNTMSRLLSKIEPLQCKGLESSLLKYNSGYDMNNINWAEASGYYKKRKKSEPLQGKGLENNLADALQSEKLNSGKKLDIPEHLNEKIQDSFGIDVTKISLLEAQEVAEMGAKATAQGNIIRFAPGQYSPDTTEGQKLLGHELNHVREQAQGKISSNIEGTNIHFDPVNEASCDRAGEAFASGVLSSATSVSISSSSGAVQGFFRRNNNNDENRTVGRGVGAGAVGGVARAVANSTRTEAYPDDFIGPRQRNLDDGLTSHLPFLLPTTSTDNLIGSQQRNPNDALTFRPPFLQSPIWEEARRIATERLETKRLETERQDIRDILIYHGIEDPRDDQIDAILLSRQYLENDELVRENAQSGGTSIFAFEGAGNMGALGTAALPQYHPDGRFNAMIVVKEGDEIVFVAENGSTLPDDPRNATADAGAYRFASQLHLGRYPAIQVRDGGMDPVDPEFNEWMASRIPAMYAGEPGYARGINVHGASTTTVRSSSEGCLLIEFNEFPDFIQSIRPNTGDNRQSFVNQQNIDNARNATSYSDMQTALGRNFRNANGTIVINRDFMSDNQREIFGLNPTVAENENPVRQPHFPYDSIISPY